MTMTKPTSEQVTFLASGSGATQRTALEKFRDVVSVKDFGAVGDGVADDTAAIQAAITAAANKALYFPSGTYVATALTVSSPCRLFGDGILKKTTAVNAAFLTISSSDVVIDGIEFRGASFDATPATTVFLDTAIKAYGASSQNPYRDLLFNNLKINGFSGFAIDVRWCENVNVCGCELKYCGYAGILFDSVIQGVVANNAISFIDSGTAGDKYGISLSRDPTISLVNAAPTTSVTVVGNVISDIPKWSGIDGHAPLNCVIVGNVVARCKNGIYTQYDSTLYAFPQPAKNVCISNNVVIGRTTASENEIGIASLGNAINGYNEAIVIENNLIVDAGSWSAAIGALGLQYSQNSIARNNTVVRAVGKSIALLTNSNRCVVENNVCNGVFGPVLSGSTSIWANVSSTNTNCMFRENRFFNTTGNSSYNAYTGIFYGTANSGVVYSRNRIDVNSIVLTGGVTRRFVDDNTGSAPNSYTDLSWEFERESCPPFTHTATGGAPRESTANQSSNFRRLPALGYSTPTSIRRARVSYRSTDTTYQIAVRPAEGGNPYVVGVYTVDGTNISASASIPDIIIDVEGIYWDD
jgi:hypothetical protein